jgi:hypothetical protein
MGTDFYRKVANSKKSVDYMLTLMSQVVRNTGLGLLIIDEVQHLCGARGLGDERMLNFFVTLVNTVGVPVILIGNPKAMSILQSEFRQARRGSGQGDMVWDRLQNNDSFDLLINSLWQCQWTRRENTLTHSLKEIIYEESQGVIDIVVKLLIMAQTVAISTGKEQVTENLIRQVAKEHFQLVRPMLLALKSGNLKEIAKYSDISVADIDYNKVLDQGKQSMEMKMRIKALQEQQGKKDKEGKVPKLEQLITKLLELGIDAKKAQKAAEQVLAADGNDAGIGKLVVKAIQSLSAVQESKKPSQTKKVPQSESDVRYIVEEGRKQGKTAYEALKGKGYIQGQDDSIFKAG